VVKLDSEVETREGMATTCFTADQALTHDSEKSLGGLQGCLEGEWGEKLCCVYVNKRSAYIHTHTYIHSHKPPGMQVESSLKVQIMWFQNTG